MRRPGTVFAALVMLLLVSSFGGCRHRSRVLTVSAAADLSDAFAEIGQNFTAETGVKVSFNFGSTGQLAYQIEQGAPVDLFAAAALGYIEALEQKGALLPESRRIYGVGRLVIWTRSDSSIRIEKLSDLTLEEIKRVAIANPEHAPYGIAARESLEAAGVWNEVQPRLVMAGNVREALRYAESGDVDAALVARSLCQPSSGQRGGSGNCILVPENLHRPLVQALGTVSNSQNRDLAERFSNLVTSSRGRAILGRYGFAVPPAEKEE